MILEDNLPFEAHRALFSTSELRGMSRASVVLRGILRAEKAQFNFGKLPVDEIGIYVLGEESSIAEFEMDHLWSLLEGTHQTLPDQFRKIPAKGFVALPASRVGAQLAMESGAAGPLICANFEPASIDFTVQEIEADFLDGSIQGFLLAAFLERRKKFAYLRWEQAWSEEIKSDISNSLRRCLR